MHACHIRSMILHAAVSPRIAQAVWAEGILSCSHHLLPWLIINLHHSLQSVIHLIRFFFRYIRVGVILQLNCSYGQHSHRSPPRADPGTTSHLRTQLIHSAVPAAPSTSYLCWIQWKQWLHPGDDVVQRLSCSIFDPVSRCG